MSFKVAPERVPPLPWNYRWRSLLGGVFACLVSLGFAGFAVFDLTSPRESHTLAEFQLIWAPEALELTLEGQLRESDEQVVIPVRGPLPARLFEAETPEIFRVPWDGRWELEAPSVWILPALLMICLLFLVIGVAALRHGLLPRFRHRRVMARPVQVTGRVITQILGQASRRGHPSHHLYLQAAIGEQEVWRYHYQPDEPRVIRQAGGVRELMPGDLFVFYIAADDPRCYFLPVVLEPVQR